MRRREDRDRYLLVLALVIVNVSVSIYAIYSMSIFSSMVNEIRESNRASVRRGILQ